MKLILGRSFIVFDGDCSKENTLEMGPGIFEMEEIENPEGILGMPWLVRKGTKIGASSIIWKSRTSTWGNDMIRIE